MTNEPESLEYRYKSTIDQCDVEDREALALYRDKRYEWLSWYELREGEPNTVQAQIFNMIYLDLVYRTLVVPRQKADEHLKIAAKSDVLAHFLDQSYVATQILSIRRLLDTRSDVFSLRRLLDDITKHRLLITREIYVCFDGLPYDSDAWHSLPDQGVESKIFGIDAPQFAEYRRSQARHETFDRLSAVSPTARKRVDRIKVSVFQKLKNWLTNGTADKLILLSNKFFAHASSTDSRGSLQNSGISFADVDNVQRALVRVERAITDLLLFIGISREVVPMPPLGLLKGLDAPYTTGDLIQKMQERWDELVAERNQWSRGIADDCLR
jgi:hypothetical protein